jgi:hypothetical protein
MNSTAAPTDYTLVDNLKYLIRKQEQAFEEAEEAVRKAQDWRETCRKRLTDVKNFLEWVREDWERSGRQLHLDDESPYAGLRLREAALLVIQRAGRPITSSEIAQVLTAHGYPGIERGRPGRALHAALIGVASVERVASGTYRWKDNNIGANDSSEAAELGSSVG